MLKIMKQIRPYYLTIYGARNKSNQIMEGKTDVILDDNLLNALNTQINKELTAFYANIAMEGFFYRFAGGLQGFRAEHASQAQEELKHARILSEILLNRGGVLSLKTLEPPQNQAWQTPKDVVRCALQLERDTAKSLMSLQSLATQLQDHHVAYALGCSMINDQMECIFTLENRLVKLENCCSLESLLYLDYLLLRKHK